MTVISSTFFVKNVRFLLFGGENLTIDLLYILLVKISPEINNPTKSGVVAILRILGEVQFWIKMSDFRKYCVFLFNCNKLTNSILNT